MTANTPAAYGVYPNDVALHQVVQALNQSGFDKQDICMIGLTQASHRSCRPRSKRLQSRARGRRGRGETDRLAHEIRRGYDPNGHHVRSPSFLRSLMAKKDSPAVYSNSKALVGLGLSEYDAVRFEHELREMGVLVYVACAESDRTTQAVEVLHRTGANETAALDRINGAGIRRLPGRY